MYRSSLPYHSSTSSSGRTSGDSGVGRTLYNYTRPTGYRSPNIVYSSPNYSVPSASTASYSSGSTTAGSTVVSSAERDSSSDRSGRTASGSGVDRSYDARPTRYSSPSVNSRSGARSTSSAESGSGARTEAERVRCSRLADGVDGRAKVVTDNEFLDKNKVLNTDTHNKSALQLMATGVNLHIDVNGRLHHTDKFEHPNLIVRRGQPFELTVTFSRAFDASQDTIILQFAVGHRPQESKGSIIRVPVSRVSSSGSWSSKVAQASKEKVTFQVSSPADAAVGFYTIFVETKSKALGSDKEEWFRYKHPDELLILFNAWCKGDSVYLDREDLREEYVLNDSGLIWMGTAAKNCGMPWNFGQFEEEALSSCLWLMDRAQLATAARGNPVRVTRCISAMANFNDQDGGVLFGRWSNDYPKDTTPPTAWPGSVAILEQFWQRKNVVKFAQCWVFSGIVTTLLRAIGIPTRPVTNFASAHDCDGSMTIDFHFDEDGKTLSELDDSVWNFHVWNESWFKRPDLPNGHDGWQAHDATPQEVSYGVFRCGPASVNAIKQGEVYLPFDTSFVFAEVNGDRVFWEVKEDGSMDVIGVDKKCIGKMIITKAVGKNDREDITNNYKHSEGTMAERRSVEMAYKFSSRKNQAIYNLPREDVKFTFEVPNDAEIGKDVRVVLKMKNLTHYSRTAKGKMTAMIGFYTGITCKDLKEQPFEITMEPRQEKTIFLDLPADLYVGKCEADGGLKIYVKATVKETDQRFASYDIIDFRKPGLTMAIIRGTAKVNRDFEAKISFVNPLPVQITGGQWHIEASGGNPKSKVTPNTVTVPPGKEVQTTLKLTPYRVGVLQVCAAFRSSVISGVRGACSVKVTD